MTSKDPDFRTFAHDGISKEKTKFTFFRIVVVQKLWKQQMGMYPCFTAKRL